MPVRAAGMLLLRPLFLDMNSVLAREFPVLGLLGQAIRCPQLSLSMAFVQEQLTMSKYEPLTNMVPLLL